MKKSFILSLLFILIFSLQSCAQATETYWQAENVTKVNKKPVNDGVRMAFMKMIEEMQIHLSQKNDSLFFAYPTKKKMKMREFKSLSNIRYADKKKELIDSVYDVGIEKDSLRIKFYFGGTKDDNRYVLTFSPLDKQNFLQKTKKLKLDKEQLFGMLKTVDYSALDLLTPKPKYFSNNFNLNLLNPVQLAEMLSVNDNGIQTGINNCSFVIKNKDKLKYTEYYIQRSDKLDFVAANVGKVQFNNLKLIYNDITKKTDAVILYQMQLTKEDVKYLFGTIYSKMSNVEINKKNLYSMEISWSDSSKIVKMIISNTSDNTSVSDEILFHISKAENPLNIEKELENYLLSVQKSETKITVVSKELAEIIKSEEFKNKIGGMPFTVDYNN